MFAWCTRKFKFLQRTRSYKHPRSKLGARRRNGAVTSLTFMGMELKDLSSNWRKLQESLKSNSKTPSSPAAKRKRSDHGAPSKVLKRPKTSAYADRRNERQEKPLRRKRTTMSTQDVADEIQHQATLNGTAPNGSIPSATERLGWLGKINEGLSPT